jgi:hypothetical protein
MRESERIRRVEYEPEHQETRNYLSRSSCGATNTRTYVPSTVSLNKMTLIHIFLFLSYYLFSILIISLASIAIKPNSQIPFTNTIHKYHSQIPFTNTIHKYHSQIPFTASVPRFLQPILRLHANLGSQNPVPPIVHNVPDDTSAIHLLSLLPLLASRYHLRRSLYHNDIVTHIPAGTEKNVVLSAIRHWRLL